MAYRTLQYSHFMSHNIVIRPMSVVIKKLVLIFADVVIASCLAFLIDLPCTDWKDWVVLAILRSLVVLIVNCVFVALFDRAVFWGCVGKVKGAAVKKGKG
jgi:uncharacterized membrane protein